MVWFEVLAGFHFCYVYFLLFRKQKNFKNSEALEPKGTPACKGPSVINHKFLCYNLVGGEFHYSGDCTNRGVLEMVGTKAK